MDITAPNLLIVDDSPAVLTMLSTLLEKKGYQVACATTGEDALNKFLAHDFNMVLTDIILPGMSGLHLLKLMKESKPDIEVVLISSSASSFNAIKALRLGAYDFIIKPIDDHEILYNVVGRTLEKHALTNENRRLINDLSEKNGALQKAVDMMKTVNKVCAVIASTMEIGDILRIMVESGVEQLGATKGYLLLLDKGGAGFSMKISVGIDKQLVNRFTLRQDQGISGLVAARNKVIRIGPAPSAAITGRMLEEDPTGQLFTAPGVLCAPLQLKERVVGVVTVSGRENGKLFTDYEADFLATLATHAAIALVNAGNFYRLKKTG
jgi:CheY-like chemotaxis protein